MGDKDGSKAEMGPSTPGSFERVNAHLYPNIQDPSGKPPGHIISPSMSFKTSVPCDKAFIKMLNILVQVGFVWMLQYKGPWLEAKYNWGGVVDTDTFIGAFRQYDFKKVPFLGIRAKLVHEHNEDIRANLVVAGQNQTRVKLKIKGPMMVAAWKKINRKVAKRLKPDR